MIRHAIVSFTSKNCLRIRITTENLLALQKILEHHGVFDEEYKEGQYKAVLLSQLIEKYDFKKHINKVQETPKEAVNDQELARVFKEAAMAREKAFHAQQQKQRDTKNTIRPSDIPVVEVMSSHQAEIRDGIEESREIEDIVEKQEQILVEKIEKKQEKIDEQKKGNTTKQYENSNFVVDVHSMGSSTVQTNTISSKTKTLSAPKNFPFFSFLGRKKRAKNEGFPYKKGKVVLFVLLGYTELDGIVRVWDYSKKQLILVASDLLLPLNLAEKMLSMSPRLVVEKLKPTDKEYYQVVKAVQKILSEEEEIRNE